MALMLSFPIVAGAVPPPEACGPEGTLQAVRRAPEMLSWQLLASGVTEGGNPAYSGLSLGEALSLAKVGASGDVAAELQRLLGIPPAVECGPAALAGAWKATVDDLAKADTSVKWSLANGAWLAKDLAPKKLWLAIAKGEFAAEITNVDFSKQVVHTLVNEWVKKKTSGKIDTLLAEPLDMNTIFVLANALYFDAAWSLPFPIEKTKETAFRGFGGDKSVPMMEATGEFAHTEGKSGALVRLPYGKTRAFEMAIWLPPSGKKLSEVVSEEGRQNLGKMLDASESAKGIVRLPRFKVDAFAPQLADTLVKLGAKKLFKFTKDWPLLAPGKEARVSRVAHRVVVDVSERGTTVAAASAVVGQTRGAMPKKPFTFTADRPFVYVLRHRTSNVWIALGAYQSP